MTPHEQPQLVFPMTQTTAPEWIPDDIRSQLEWYIWFLETNGNVYQEFRKLCDEALTRNPGITLSADRVLHYMRFETELKGKGDTFKLNDHLTALFARLYVLERPEHRRKFRSRKSILDMLDKNEEERLLLAFEPLRVNKRRFV